MALAKGLYTALLTPFGSGGEINGDALQALVRHNISQGMDGLYVGGSTGEAFLMTIEEREAVLSLTAESAAGDCVLMAHVGDTNPAVSARLAKHAAACGYDAISAVPPFYYGHGFEALRQHYAWLAAQTDLPFVVYHFPALSGITFTAEQLATLLEIPQVVGVKNTCSDYYAFEQLRRRCPDALLFNGFDETMLAGLGLGADGGIGSTYNVQGDRFRALVEAYTAGDAEGARAIQAEANALIDVIVRHGVFPSLKFLLELGGIPMGRCRPPFLPLSAEARSDLEQVAERFLAPRANRESA